MTGKCLCDKALLWQKNVLMRSCCRAVKCRYNVKLYCVIAENALRSIEFYCFRVLWWFAYHCVEPYTSYTTVLNYVRPELFSAEWYYYLIWVYVNPRSRCLVVHADYDPWRDEAAYMCNLIHNRILSFFCLTDECYLTVYKSSTEQSV